MKTTRRQELRTNDLSQQIEQIRNSLKDNATMITVVVVAVAALSFGGYWYYGQQTSRLEDAYSQLGKVTTGDDPADRLEKYQTVARQQISPALTLTAWSRAGDLALSLLTAPPIPAVDPANPTETPAPLPDRDKLTQAAEEAFTNVLTQAANDPLARGHALIALGVLDEDRGQFVKAREWYEKVLADDDLKALPFHGEAKFRIAGLESWSKAADFPPPPPMVLVSPQGQPITSENVTANTPASLPPTTSPPTIATQTTPPAAATAAPQAATENQASSPQPSADSPAPGTASTPRPTPTTQPASSD